MDEGRTVADVHKETGKAGSRCQVSKGVRIPPFLRLVRYTIQQPHDGHSIAQAENALCTRPVHIAGSEREETHDDLSD